MKKLKNYPFVSVIVPAYNSMFFIERFVRSIAKTNYPKFEVIIVDDCSTDGTREFLRKQAQLDNRLKIVETVRRRGLPRSRNMAIESAQGEYIAFAETDMLFDKEWLTEGVSVMERDISVGAITGKVFDYAAKDIIQTVGLKLIPQTTWVVCRGFGENDSKELNKQVEASMGSVGTIVRKSVLADIHGYDEEMDRIDDIDLGWRIWLSGKRIVTVPSSVTYHVTAKSWNVRKSSVTVLQQEILYGRALRMMLKNYELGNIIKYYPQAVSILLFRALLSIVKGNFYPTLGVFFIFYWGIISFRSTLRERRIVQSQRKISDKQLFASIMIRDNLYNIYIKYVTKAKKRFARFPVVE